MSFDFNLAELAGWAGAVLILTAYGLLSVGKLSGRSLAYQTLNIVGALGFIANGWAHRALPSTTLNVVWVAIGAYAN